MASGWERFLACLLVGVCGCGPGKAQPSGGLDAVPVRTPGFELGVDLSRLNEMLDCGARYRVEEVERDPYEILASSGATLARVRLWHSPGPREYSGLADVRLSLRRAKAQGMRVLLDLHYSDTWADPGHQSVPDAWKAFAGDEDRLARAVYDYTAGVLRELIEAGLAPSIVQVGNEVNTGLLWPGEAPASIDWKRTATLLGAGLRAVHDVALSTQTPLESMLHVAQPENAAWWFEEARRAGLDDFDWIGLSYYPQWSRHDLDGVGVAVHGLVRKHGKRVMVVETGYPWTPEWFDQTHNVLGDSGLLAGYPASPEGQARFLRDLLRVVRESGGGGVLYWEPGWVSTPCATPWGVGSSWENATWFDETGRALPVLDVYRAFARP